ncbi:hypothetical protein H4582DRAFT_2132466 [Lactarius indigo]|nr:hypothetical protein H4582DRAFT_2132466 [Lactarius indigo]
MAYSLIRPGRKGRDTQSENPELEELKVSARTSELILDQKRRQRCRSRRRTECRRRRQLSLDETDSRSFCGMSVLLGSHHSTPSNQQPVASLDIVADLAELEEDQIKNNSRRASNQGKFNLVSKVEE